MLRHSEIHFQVNFSLKLLFRYYCIIFLPQFLGLPIHKASVHFHELAKSVQLSVTLGNGSNFYLMVLKHFYILPSSKAGTNDVSHFISISPLAFGFITKGAECQIRQSSNCAKTIPTWSYMLFFPAHSKNKLSSIYHGRDRVLTRVFTVRSCHLREEFLRCSWANLSTDSIYISQRRKKEKNLLFFSLILQSAFTCCLFLQRQPVNHAQCVCLSHLWVCLSALYHALPDHSVYIKHSWKVRNSWFSRAWGIPEAQDLQGKAMQRRVESWTVWSKKME